MCDRTVAAIEAHVRAVMDGAARRPTVIAHGYDHVDRVRRWALRIAGGEGLARRDLVEATALLHDIGLAQMETRGGHAHTSAALAEAYLDAHGWFSRDEVAAIVGAIRAHSDITPIPPIHGAPLAEGLRAVLREADILDALGAVGLMRACMSKGSRPAYDPRDVRGPTWGLSGDGFTALRGRAGVPSATVIDQVNLQIAIYDNLRSETARRFGQPLVATMRAFVEQLAAEVGE